MTPPNGLHLNVNELRRQEELCDVVIKVGNKRFPCHRVILASAMRYFRNMFAQNFIEAGKEEIELKGVREYDFELLLAHVYGNMVCLNDSNNAYCLLRISHYLDLNDLDSLCAACMHNSDWIPWKTAAQIFLFASRIGRTDLADAFVQPVAANFTAVSKFDKFFRVSGTSLLKIFAHPQLLKDATTTLDFLTNWMKIQSEENRNMLPELLHTLDLDHVSNEWIVKIITENITQSRTLAPAANKKRKKEVKGDSPNVLKARHGTFKNEDLFSDLESDAESSQPSTSALDLPFTLYVHNIQDDNHSINRYKFTSAKMVQLVDLDIDCEIDYSHVEFFKSLSVDEFNYFMIGVSGDDEDKDSGPDDDDDDSDSSCSKVPKSSSDIAFTPYISYESRNYRLETMLFTGVPSHHNVDDVTVATCGTDIYLYSPEKFIKYNCTIDSWINGPDVCLKTQRSNLVSHQGSLYIVGGIDLNYARDDSVGGTSFQHYDVRLKGWSRLPNMTHSHIKSASCVHNDILYVTGGEYLTYFKGYIECFDFKAGKWFAFESSMPKPKLGHTLLAHNNGLWFFGGNCYDPYDHDNAMSDLHWYWYSLSENKWSDIYCIPRTYGRLVMDSIWDVVVDV